MELKVRSRVCRAYPLLENLKHKSWNLKHKRKKKKPEGIVPIDILVNKYGGTFRRRKTKQEIKIGVLIPAISVNKI